MFNGKRKAVTFSYDDGVTQDIGLIEILDRYGLKCTFNLNSGTLGNKGTLVRNNVTVPFDKVEASDVERIYRNHEVAVHTVTHPDLTALSNDEIIYEIERDRETLSELSGQKVVGMAYPGGNADLRVAGLIENKTGILYSRTIKPTHGFEKQKNLFLFNPTVHAIKKDLMFELADRFLNDSSENEMLFYIWGHAFEFDAYDSWEWFEQFCRLISGHNDIFYGTNSEVLL